MEPDDRMDVAGKQATLFDIDIDKAAQFDDDLTPEELEMIR